MCVIERVKLDFDTIFDRSQANREKNSGHENLPPCYRVNPIVARINPITGWNIMCRIVRIVQTQFEHGNVIQAGD